MSDVETEPRSSSVFPKSVAGPSDDSPALGRNAEDDKDDKAEDDKDQAKIAPADPNDKDQAENDKGQTLPQPLTTREQLEDPWRVMIGHGLGTRHRRAKDYSIASRIPPGLLV